MANVFYYFSIILFLMCIPALFVKLPENKIATLNANVDNRSLKEVLRGCTQRFQIVSFRIFCLQFQITLIYSCSQICTRQRIGRLDRNSDTGTYRFFNIIGTLIMGYLGDKYSKKILLSGLYFLRGITLILFIFLPASNLSAILFGTTFGLLWLATVPATNGIVAQIFGTKNLTLLLVQFLNHQFGSFLELILEVIFTIISVALIMLGILQLYYHSSPRQCIYLLMRDPGYYG